MKTVAKVFVILGMICGAIAIIPLIVGGITLSKMKKAKCKADMTVMGVLCIFFVGVLSGIFILCTSEEEWAQN